MINKKIAITITVSSLTSTIETKTEGSLCSDGGEKEK